MNNDYHFVTRWRVRGTAQEVYALVSHPLDYPRWWPSVYLNAVQIAPPDEHGLGRRMKFLTKGWLPYTLQWESQAIESDAPNRLVIRATGDFNGRGIWSITQDGEFAKIEFDWQLTADKPLLRQLSFLLKPVFSANHVWAMTRGQESLNLELTRIHARTPEEHEQIAKPPGPNRTSGVWLSLAGLGVLAALTVLCRAALH